MRRRSRCRRRRAPRKYWTRKGIAEWLVERLAEDVPTLVGIDHGFSFPLRYFEAHGLKPDWPRFLDDFQRHWPTDEDHSMSISCATAPHGNGAARMGNARWRRLTEERAGGAKSVFHFDVQGSVAKSTHAGIPWLRFIRQRLGARVHFWPFDGWDIPAGRSAIVEVYPALWARGFANEGRTGDQHDAYSIAAWLSRADRDGGLADALRPVLAPDERSIAEIEGWILGVPGPPQERKHAGPGGRALPSKKAAPMPPTTIPGYVNHNGQRVVRKTDLPGNDHLQKTYELQCGHCEGSYGANGSDIWLRRCPHCQKGAPGLPLPA